ncbi:hypothetical protein AAON49_09915 [Pseudotenacibaculum sp. MALMAid0570]|uniref:hypothetical protein n=1 Tax=Pseudotenacibaculum sp. MALMAid0570 TaxID=3143938 RepID=UPI0032DFD3C1
MKKHPLIIVFISVLFSCTPVQKENGKFKNKEGRFKISFPSQPILSEKSGETEYGKLTNFSFKSVSKNDDNLSYQLSYLDYPLSFTDTLTVDHIYALFNGAQNTNINSKTAELIGVFNHKILGYTGREFRWKDTETKNLIRIRFYLVKNRMYILTVRTEEKNNFNVGINQFFDSFELINTESIANADASDVLSDEIFTISFPKEPENRELETPTDYGTAKTKAKSYQPKLKNDDNLIYVSAIQNYSKDITKTEGFNLEKYYSNKIQGTIIARQSALISKKKIIKNGIEGVEMKESFRNGQIVIKTWMFLKGNLHISIQVMTIPKNDGNKAMNDFFNSFFFIKD